MMRWLKDIPYPLLAGVAILFALMPFQPEPHLAQKWGMLMQGSLNKAIDMGDVLWHLLPTLLLLLKFMMHKREG